MGEGICAKTSTPINEDVKMANSRNKYLIYGRILFNLKIVDFLMALSLYNLMVLNKLYSIYLKTAISKYL
jgi:hypothetical protein